MRISDWSSDVCSSDLPHAARALGIGMVFQHFSLFEAMTVLENIALGMDRAEDRRVLARRVREVSQAYGLPLDPEREVYTLSAASPIWPRRAPISTPDRKSVGSGKSVEIRVELGGGRLLKKKKKTK